MTEMHIRQPKTKERIKTFKETEDSRYIYQNKLDEACFQHDITYGDFKDLNRRTAADKVLHNKAFNIAKNPKCVRYQCGVASMVYKFLDKRSAPLVDKSTSGGTVKNVLYIISMFIAQTKY